MQRLDRRTFVAGLSVALTGPATARGPGTPAVIAAYEAATGGHIGLYARNVATGRTIAWRPDERMVMCSTFKASLAACVLARVDRGRARLADRLRLDAADVQDWHAPVARANLARGAMSVGEMCRAVVEQSDNSCANILLREIGGPAGMTRFWRALGDDVTRLDDVEPVLNRTPPGGIRSTTTARSMATILETLTLGPVLSTGSRATLVAWLKGCRTGDNRLRAGLPDGWAVGDKTGNNGRDAAGDIALVWPRPGAPIVVSVYTRGGSPVEAQFAALFAGIGRAVAATLA